MMAQLSLVIYITLHNGANAEPEGAHFVNVLVIERGESCLSVPRTYRMFSSLRPYGRFMARNEVSRQLRGIHFE
jgi:hypothetical protein